MNSGLSKKERISSLKAIEQLIARGHYVGSGPLRCCWIQRGNSAGAEDGSIGSYNRIVVSVSKRLFKRAVKRNLLKRRIREAYRLQKELLPPISVDMMFIYKSKEAASYEDIRKAVETILGILASKTAPND